MDNRKRVLLTQPEDDSSECGSTPTRDKPISEFEGSSRGHSAVRVSSSTARSEFSRDSVYSDARSPDATGRASAATDYVLISTRENSLRRRNESLSQEVLEEEDEQEEEEGLEDERGRGEEDNASDEWGVSGSDSEDEGGSTRELRDSDYDTDLELNDDKWLYPERYDRDTTGLAKYLKTCQDLGLQPVRYFIKHMQDDSLKLRHHGLGPRAMKALAAPLEINTTIERMDLEGNWILAEGAGHLCRVLKENVFLTQLNLSENRIENEGAQTVCQLLISNRTIEKLNLAGNSIGDQTGEMFHSLLTQKNTALRHLNLRHNKLEDGAAQWFRDALVDNETLEHLDLSWNHFQCKGCMLLAEGLKENVGLKKLSVAMNGFGLVGGKELGKAISANRTLRKLDASYCRLPVESAPYLALGLECNDVLHSLDLSYNALNADSAYAMLAQLEKNDSSGLKLLNFGNTKVYDKFEELQEKLKLERGLKVIHGGVLEEHRKEVVEVDPLEAFKRDPMTKLKEWVAKAGYRLIDLLRHFDKDQSMSISIDEFRQGIAATSIEITEEQLQILVSRLDQDGDGEIDFSELMEGDKNHRKTKREIDKYLMEKEEMARNSVDETEREFSSRSSNS